MGILGGGLGPKTLKRTRARMTAPQARGRRRASGMSGGEGGGAGAGGGSAGGEGGGGEGGKGGEGGTFKMADVQAYEPNPMPITPMLMTE